MKTEEIVARAHEMSGVARPAGPVTPGAATTSNAPDTRPRTATRAGQDVEVKAGEQPKKPSEKENNKDKGKEKDKKPAGSPILRNP
jgi:hypothetical protein